MRGATVLMLPSRFRPRLPPPPLRFPAGGAVFDERLFMAHCKKAVHISYDAKHQIELFEVEPVRKVDV
jgi:hypothetical protein